MIVSKSRLFILILLTIMLIYLMPIDHTVQAEEAREIHTVENEWQKLNKLAEESLFLFKKKEYEAARKALLDLSSQFLAIEPGAYLDTVEDVRIILEAIVQAKESLTPVKLDQQALEAAEKKLLRMRLAIDAVSHKKQPLWLQYYPKISKLLHDIQMVIETGERDQFYLLLNQVNSEYELIRPALYVSHPVGLVEQIDSMLTYIQQNKGKLWEDKDQALQNVKKLDQLMKQAFFQEVRDAYQSLLYILLAIGTVIFSVLGYVAWRKYRGEQERRTVAWKKEP